MSSVAPAKLKRTRHNVCALEGSEGRMDASRGREEVTRPGVIATEQLHQQVRGRGGKEGEGNGGGAGG
eukprot:766617-Hanusia_phi.AAC.1